MAKLRYNPASGLSEWEGTSEELLAIYDQLIERSKIKNTRHFLASTLIKRAPLTDLELMAKMPTQDKLIEHITSKPRYEHDIVEIANKFFGGTVQCRKFPHIYRKLSYDLDKARKTIEAEHKGAFVQQPTPARNLKKYVFKSLTQTLNGTLQKTPTS